MPSIPPEARIRRRDSLLSNDLNDTEMVMLDIDRGIYFGLQSVGKAIWQQLSTTTTLNALCQHLMLSYDVDEATCRADLVTFVTELLAAGLIEVEDNESTA